MNGLRSWLQPLLFMKHALPHLVKICMILMTAEFSCFFGCFPFAVCGPKLQWTKWSHIAWKPASKTAGAGPDWKSQISPGSQNLRASEVSYLTESGRSRTILDVKSTIHRSGISFKGYDSLLPVDQKVTDSVNRSEIDASLKRMTLPNLVQLLSVVTPGGVC